MNHDNDDVKQRLKIEVCFTLASVSASRLPSHVTQNKFTFVVGRWCVNIFGSGICIILLV